MDLKRILLQDLQALEKLNSSRLLLWCSKEHNGKMIGDMDVKAIYKCISAMGPTKRLDLILHTEGGQITSAVRIANLLRDFCEELNIIVPYKARSAGTLLCLAANTISMGRCAEISPIDPIVRGRPSPDYPEFLSSEDLRCFPSMIHEWFSLKTDEHKLEALGILAQKIFPTTLTGFFRADKYIREVASQLLGYHIPVSEYAKKDKIVATLIEGYHDHLHAITRREAVDAGLNVTAPAENEDNISTRMLETAWKRIEAIAIETDNVDVNALILCTEVELVHSMQYSSLSSKPSDTHQQKILVKSRWTETA